jgi:peptide-methionine (S)-S-oxide reductase
MKSLLEMIPGGNKMSILLQIISFALLGGLIACNTVKSTASSPDLRDVAPQVAVDPAESKGTQIAVFAGGCFWGVEAVFEHVKGVVDVKSGYSGGDAKTANYEQVSDGDTGHAESVRITYDPSKVTYVQLLTVFFSVAHDPTELNRQGPDTGTQYRSAIFYTDENQKKLAHDYIDAINKSKALPKPVVTEVVQLREFFEAEAYHQDYLVHHPDQPYIVINDAPKVADLKKRFPELYVDK